MANKWVIRRPTGGRKFKYFNPDDTTKASSGNWKNYAGDGFTFRDEATAKQYMRDNRKLFSFDDTAIEYRDYDGTICPSCLNSNVRRDGHARDKTILTVDMSCPYCNTRWQDTFVINSGPTIIS